MIVYSNLYMLSRYFDDFLYRYGIARVGIGKEKPDCSVGFGWLPNVAYATDVRLVGDVPDFLFDEGDLHILDCPPIVVFVANL